MDLTSSNVCGCFNMRSYNCRSIKRSLPEVQQLCEKHDLVVLQEHWLLPDELPLLSGVHADFLANGTSAVDVSNTILVVRPYGVQLYYIESPLLIAYLLYQLMMLGLQL